MSWDNVTGIKNIKIWTDYADSTQGHLFVNDQHRLALYVGLSFNLNSKNPVGPTQDEVKSALSLINNQDSGPLKYLQIAEENRYTAVYDPNHIAAAAPDYTNNVDDGIYDYQLTYTVASPTSINAGCYCEGVALKLEYFVTDSSGNTTKKVIETSRSGTGSSVKTYVAVVCYPAKLYGNKGGNCTTIVSSRTEVTNADRSLIDANFTHEDDYFSVQALSLDDPYFKIVYFDGCVEPGDDTLLDPYYIHRTSESTMWDEIYNSFFPKVKCGEFTFDVNIRVQSILGGEHILSENITVHQKEGQISFLTSYVDVKRDPDNSDMSNNIHLHIYDQFGNKAYAVIYSNLDEVLTQSIS